MNLRYTKAILRKCDIVRTKAFVKIGFYCFSALCEFQTQKSQAQQIFSNIICLIERFKEIYLSLGFMNIFYFIYLFHYFYEHLEQLKK